MVWTQINIALNCNTCVITDSTDRHRCNNVVTDGHLKCENNLTHNAVREGDLFEFGCTVTHSGLWNPHLRWSDIARNLTNRRLVRRPSRQTNSEEGNSIWIQMYGFYRF